MQTVPQGWDKQGEAQEVDPGLFSKFSELSNEETPMVRRVIATKIGEMALVYEKEHIINDLITSFKQLSTDEQDLVRVLCLDSLKALAKVLSRD